MIYSRKVIAVSRIFLAIMPDLVRIGPDTFRFTEEPLWENLDIEVPAALTISSTVEKKQPFYTAKLVFKLCARNFTRAGVYVYMVTLANGDKLLIGGEGRPYPTCSTSRQLTPSGSSSELLEVTIDYKSSKEIATIR